MSLKEMAKAAAEKESPTLIGEISKQLRAEQEYREWDGYYHVSSLYKCGRIFYYDSTNRLYEKFSNETLMIFQFGHASHALIQEILCRAGLIPSFSADPSGLDGKSEYLIEVPLINKKHKIKGSCDAIVDIDGARRILEFKTCGSSTFRMLSGPLPQHVVQCMVYMWLSGLRDYGIILYLNKDNQHMKEYRVTYRQDIIDRVLQKFALVTQARELLQIEKIPNEFIDKDCRDSITAECVYSRRCKKMLKVKLQSMEPTHEEVNERTALKLPTIPNFLEV